MNVDCFSGWREKIIGSGVTLIEKIPPQKDRRLHARFSPTFRQRMDSSLTANFAKDCNIPLNPATTGIGPHRYASSYESPDFAR